MLNFLPTTWSDRRPNPLRRPLIFATLLSSLLSCMAAPITLAGNQLTEANFEERIKDGLWMVEHFSPFCAHCRKFAPTWEKLVQAVEPWEARGLHLGQVDCIAQADLCSKLEIRYYPYLRLYQDGKQLETYDGDRTLEALQEFLDSKSAIYMSHNPLPARPPPPDTPDVGAVDPKAAALPKPDFAIDEPDIKRADPAKAAQQLAAPPAAAGGAALAGGVALEGQDKPKGDEMAVVPGPKGEVIKLSKDTWKRYSTAGADVGPTFIKYFAPWCSHCKHLAPTWEDLAHLLKGQVNVAELDCDRSDTKALCRDERVTGFPTLIFYHDGSRVEYRGTRALTQLEAFAKKAAASTGVRDITPMELQEAIHGDEVFFLLLYSSSTPPDHVAAVHNSAKSFLGSVVAFKSDSPQLFERFSIPHETTALLVFKEFEEQPYSHITLGASTAPAAVRDQVRTWMQAEKLPLVPELSGANHDELMKSPRRSLIVLASISEASSGADAAEKARSELKTFAKTWRFSSEAEKAKMRVQWVWVDVDKWGKYLKKQYNIKPSAEPSVIVIDPHRFEYYDVDASATRIAWSDEGIFKALDDVENRRLDPNESRDFAEKIAHAIDTWSDSFTWFVANHYIIFFLIFFGALAFLAKLVISTLDTDTYTAVEPRSRRNESRHRNNGFQYLPPSAKAD